MALTVGYQVPPKEENLPSKTTTSLDRNSCPYQQEPDIRRMCSADFLVEAAVNNTRPNARTY